MALTRKYLTALGIEAEKIDEIINAHSETVEALKEERDSFKGEAEQATKLRKDLEIAKKEIEDLNKEDSYKVKYDALKEDYDTFKKKIESEKITAAKTDDFRALLKEIGVSEKRIDSIIKVSGSTIDSIKKDKDGKIEGLDDLKKSLGEEWSDFIVKDFKEGAGTAAPPAKAGVAKMSKDEILAIKDTSARQKAMLENKDLFI